MSASLPDSPLYTALGEGHIRLIQLRRRPEDNELEAILQPASFAETPQYQALSYVWGQQKRREERRL